MGAIFWGASAFNGDLSSWNVSSVTDMYGMFLGAISFNDDLSSWDVSFVTDMTSMFEGATSFGQDLCNWGDKFPYSSSSNIFLESGCTDRTQPSLDQRGPFCASSSCQ